MWSAFWMTDWWHRLSTNREAKSTVGREEEHQERPRPMSVSVRPWLSAVWYLSRSGWQLLRGKMNALDWGKGSTTSPVFLKFLFDFDLFFNFFFRVFFFFFQVWKVLNLVFFLLMIFFLDFPWKIRLFDCDLFLLLYYEALFWFWFEKKNAVAGW